MYIQCQSSDEKFFKLGSFTGYTKPYRNDVEARNNFFDSLINETNFYIDNERIWKLKILAVKRQEIKGSPYLEFTATGGFNGEADIPITGIIAFKSL